MAITKQRLAEREAAVSKKSLRSLTDTLLVFIDRMHSTMNIRDEAKLREHLTKLVSWLEMENDLIRYRPPLSIDFATDNKARKVRAIVKKRAPKLTI